MKNQTPLHPNASSLQDRDARVDKLPAGLPPVTPQNMVPLHHSVSENSAKQPTPSSTSQQEDQRTGSEIKQSESGSMVTRIGNKIAEHKATRSTRKEIRPADKPLRTASSEAKSNKTEKESVEGAKNTSSSTDTAASRWEIVQERLRDLFDFRRDKEPDTITIEQFKADVEFRGTKLWILICAILVASIGLNVNSTAVIIGAMLISPLMGPIIGFGLGLGIWDFDLIKKSLRNLVIATLFSILTATVYFLISPLSQPGSELLGRTHPTMYDVLIAFVGGAAGIIAGSTKSKGQVLPGVAIATALMPPLCTAGYGLASGQFNFFFGALYLFIINSVFIAFATYTVARLMKFPKKRFLDNQRAVRIRRTIAVIAICTLSPSIYLSAILIRDSYRNERITGFVLKEMNFPGTQVIKKELIKEGNMSILNVVLLGEHVTQEQIDSAQLKMSDYGLKDVRLSVHQGFEQQETDLGELRQAVLQDFYDNAQATIARQNREIDSLKLAISGYDRYAELNREINGELPLVFTSLNKVRLIPSIEYLRGQDSILLVVATPKNQSVRIPAGDKTRLSRWLMTKTGAAKVRIIEEQ